MDSDQDLGTRLISDWQIVGSIMKCRPSWRGIDDDSKKGDEGCLLLHERVEPNKIQSISTQFYNPHGIFSKHNCNYGLATMNLAPGTHETIVRQESIDPVLTNLLPLATPTVFKSPRL